jgi:membrane protein YdbS with pleckstrin-like domain
MMPLMGFPKKLLGEGESLVLELRPHVKRLVGPVLLLLVTVPVATFVAGLVPDGGMQGWVRGAITVAAVLVVLRWSLWPFLVWWNTVYVVTDRRLVMRTGVLTRSGHDMPLTRMNDVSFTHNLFQRMLGCGTLVVESGGERGQVKLTDVPQVEQVQRTLYRLSDAARQGGPADWQPDWQGDAPQDDDRPAGGVHPGGLHPGGTRPGDGSDPGATGSRWGRRR